jgi:hypothetical protein
MGHKGRILDKEGVFVPTTNGKVIEFRNYRFGPSSLRIYNLPGNFVQTNNKGKEKD